MFMAEEPVLLRVKLFIYAWGKDYKGLHRTTQKSRK